MFRPFSLFLAWRLLTGRGRRWLLLLCVAGVVLGVAGQVLVGGVMQGMMREVERGVRSYCPQVLVYSERWSARELTLLPGVRQVREGTAGQALVNGKLCTYVSGLPLEAWAGGVPEGEGCWLSRSCAERLGFPQVLAAVFPPRGESCLLKVQGVFHVPGRMHTPDVVSGRVLPGLPVLGLRLEDGASFRALEEQVRQRDAGAQVIDGLEDGRAWLAMLAQFRAVVGFLFGVGVMASAFGAGAILLVAGWQSRGSMAVCLAMGARPAWMVAVYGWQALLLMAAAVPAGLLTGYLALLGREQLAALFEACGLGMYDARALDMPLPAAVWPGLFVYAGLSGCLALALSVLPAAWAALRADAPRVLAGSGG